MCIYTKFQANGHKVLTDNRKYFTFGSHTLNSAYNEKKYAEILLPYRRPFVKGNVFIGEGVYLMQRFSFVIAHFSLKATSL